MMRKQSQWHGEMCGRMQRGDWKTLKSACEDILKNGEDPTSAKNCHSPSIYGIMNLEIRDGF